MRPQQCFHVDTFPSSAGDSIEGEYNQAYHLLLIMEEVNTPNDYFSYNKPFVNCRNGVYDIVNGKLVAHSPSFTFRNCIQANYDPDAEYKVENQTSSICLLGARIL